MKCYIMNRIFLNIFLSEIGQIHGCHFVKILAANHYSALAVEKLGFQLVYSLKYEDYIVNGTVLLRPELPHQYIKVYVLKL